MKFQQTWPVIENMLRIVQFKVDYKKLIEATKTNGPTVRAIQKYTKLNHVGEDFLSEPMATTDPRYFHIEGCLRAVWGDRFNWDVVDLSAEYKLFRTRAPQAYDYDYIVEIATMPGETERETERLVAIPLERIEYQSGRYSSGMYTPIDCS